MPNMFETTGTDGGSTTDDAPYALSDLLKVLGVRIGLEQEKAGDAPLAEPWRTYQAELTTYEAMDPSSPEAKTLINQLVDVLNTD